MRGDNPAKGSVSVEDGVQFWAVQNYLLDCFKYATLDGVGTLHNLLPWKRSSAKKGSNSFFNESNFE